MIRTLSLTAAALALMSAGAWAGDCGWGHKMSKSQAAEQMAATDATAEPEALSEELLVANLICADLEGAARASCVAAQDTTGE